MLYAVRQGAPASRPVGFQGSFGLYAKTQGPCLLLMQAGVFHHGMKAPLTNIAMTAILLVVIQSPLRVLLTGPGSTISWP